MAVSTLTPLPPARPLMPAAITAARGREPRPGHPARRPRGGPPRARRAHPGPVRPGGAVAVVGARAGGRGLRGPRRPRAVVSPGAGGGPRAGRPERDHLHRRGVRQVPRLSAARAHRRAGGRHRALRHADQGPGRRPAPVDPRARPARGAGGRLRRRLDPGRTGLGAQPRPLPADHAGHAAPGAAARAQPLVGVLQPAELRGGGRVPRVPGGVRLARGARAAAAAPGGGASRSG